MTEDRETIHTDNLSPKELHDAAMWNYENFMAHEIRGTAETDDAKLSYEKALVYEEAALYRLMERKDLEPTRTKIFLSLFWLWLKKKEEYFFMFLAIWHDMETQYIVDYHEQPCKMPKRLYLEMKELFAKINHRHFKIPEEISRSFEPLE